MESINELGKAPKIILAAISIIMGLLLLAYGAGFAVGKIEKLFF